MAVTIRRNVVANLMGQVWPAVLALLIVPVYIARVGPEGYGLVGFLVTMQSLLTILDLGLGVAINRELARHQALSVPASESRNLLRSLELIYLLTALVIAGGVVCLAPFIANHFLDAKSIDRGTLRLAITLMGAIIGCRWPISLYAGVLRARDRQATLNAVLVIEASLRGLGAVVLLLTVSQSVIVLFACFLVGAAGQLAALVRLAWLAMPRADDKPHFSLASVRSVYRFTLQMTAASLLATALKQTDTIAVAGLLPLSMLGYYSLAWAVCGCLLFLSTAVYASVVPRLAAYFAADDAIRLRMLYHQASQIVAFVVCPAGWALAFFAHDILSVWTRSPATSGAADVAVTVLSLAFMLNAMMQVPLALQVSSGRVSLQIWVNGIAVIFVVPSILFGVVHFGIAGAGVSWLAFNVVSITAVPFFMHRHLLVGEHWNWVRNDCAPFVIVGGAAMACAYVVARHIGGRLTFIPACLGALLVYGIAAGRWCQPVVLRVQRLSFVRARISFAGNGSTE